MIDAELLKILCCPETHQPLAMAEPELVARLNARVAAAQLSDRAGRPVTEPLDGGLVRSDRKVLYPVRGGIPVLLIDAGIPLD